MTPYHLDFEHNFLLQIRGRKLFKLLDPQDRRLLPEVAREHMVCGGHRNLEHRDEFAEHAHAFELMPGDGVHLPLSSPHWVRVGEEVSISLSVTFQTIPSMQTIAARQAGLHLRKLGITPTPVGRSPPLDSIKY